MKKAKIFILLWLLAFLINSCAPKTLTGTYNSIPSTPSFQNHSRVLLYLYSDSTFRYMELTGSCWYNIEYESVGSWTTYNKTIILNSSKAASDTMRLFAQKEVKYKEFKNYSLILKRKKLIDSAQTNTCLKILRKTSSATKILAGCVNDY